MLHFAKNCRFFFGLPLAKLLMMSSYRRFVEQSMGTKYLENTRLEFMTLYEDSSPSTSMFFILSPGVDPLRDVEKLGSI